MAANLGLDLADPNLTLADVEALVERAKKFGAPPETPTGARDVQGRVPAHGRDRRQEDHRACGARRSPQAWQESAEAREGCAVFLTSRTPPDLTRARFRLYCC